MYIADHTIAAIVLSEKYLTSHHSIAGVACGLCGCIIDVGGKRDAHDVRRWGFPPGLHGHEELSNMSFPAQPPCHGRFPCGGVELTSGGISLDRAAFLNRIGPTQQFISVCAWAANISTSMNPICLFFGSRYWNL
jgi:hypothetical protein